jgi:hypothetical protein
MMLLIGNKRNVVVVIYLFLGIMVTYRRYIETIRVFLILFNSPPTLDTSQLSLMSVLSSLCERDPTPP